VLEPEDCKHFEKVLSTCRIACPPGSTYLVAGRQASFPNFVILTVRGRSEPEALAMDVEVHGKNQQWVGWTVDQPKRVQHLVDNSKKMD